MTVRFLPQGFSEKPASRRQPLVDGATKALFAGPETNSCVLYYKDFSTRHDLAIAGKGAINNRIAELLMRRLADVGIPNHFIRQLNMREQLVRATEVIPLIVDVQNFAINEDAARLGLDIGFHYPRPIIDLRYKAKSLGNPLISPSHVFSLGWASEDELEEILMVTQRINDFLQGQLIAVGLRLLNFRLEFGRFYFPDLADGTRVILIDDLSPDTFMVSESDKQPVEPLMGANMYQEIARRFGILAQEAEKSHGHASE